MNESINLVEILKDYPKGTKLYSTTYGEVEFVAINDHSSYPIITRTKNNLALTMTASGKCTCKYEDAECILFPSKDQRDWSKFKVLVEKFDYSTLKPFDKVLVRNNTLGSWRCDLLSHFNKFSGDPLFISTQYWRECIPYNEDTKYLLGTKCEAPEYYKWWEE